jgi:hypothetical protein
LCFLQDKSKLLNFDDLVNICTGFYTWEEVSLAKSLLVSRLKDRRLGKHTGADEVKIKKTVNDMLRIVLDPTVALPTFYATQLSRLPPVGIDHIDTSALMQEVAALRAEVRSFIQLRNDIKDIRTSIAQSTSVCARPDQLRDQPFIPVSPQLATNPPLLATKPPGSVSQRNSVEDAQALASSTAASYAGAVRRGKTATIIGKATTQTKLKSARRMKHLDIFVSRLDPDTVKTEVEEDVKNVIRADDGLIADVSQVSCVQLKTKHDSYASFHVCILLRDTSFNRAADILMSADIWPVGTLIRRFYSVKNKENNGNSDISE